MNARERILGRLYAAPRHNIVLSPDIAGYHARHEVQEDAAQRLRRFRAAIEAAHAEVFDASDSTWPELVLHIAREKGLRNLLTGTGPPHVAKLAAQCGKEISLATYAQAVESWRDALFDDIDASLTLARGAIADTGSLILWPDANEPRLLSLVPPVHIVLLDPSHIHADLTAAMKSENWAAGLPTNALLISGPSKTADIQQVLAYGAHGPKELIVLVCPGLGRIA